MTNAKILELSSVAEHIHTLRKGELVLLSGVMYTARDRAHKRLVAALDCGETPPIPLAGATIYYCGPTPAPHGQIIGSCGPTTSGRMDAYTPKLLDAGVKILVGKGVRSTAVAQAIKANGAAYLSAIGGAAALYQSRVTACELVAYPDLDCEAIYKLTVKDFPAVVSIK